MGIAIIAAITAIGFFSAFIGSIAGLLAAKASRNTGARAGGALSGFTAGLLIAFICFEILEEGFEGAPVYIGVSGLLTGALCAAYIDGIVSSAGAFGRGGPALVAAIGVMLHHLPEGVALGGLCAVSPAAGLKLAAVIAVHCAPEAASIFVSGSDKDPNAAIWRNPILFCGLLAFPMAAGSLAGALLTEISDVFMSFSLTFAGGIMLYITCGETLPEAKRLWSGRLTTLCAVLGFILGVVITA